MVCTLLVGRIISNHYELHTVKVDGLKEVGVVLDT